MPCDICGYTVQNVGAPDARIFWCPRCGSLLTERGEQRSTDAPKLVASVKATQPVLPPEPVEENERRAAALRAASRQGDGKPEGTRESMETCARMLDTYAPDCFPANEVGQVHFARAMMESVADEIRAYFASEGERLKEVTGWAQAVLTALNVGDVQSGSPLHLKLREVMIAYRAAGDVVPNKEQP